MHTINSSVERQESILIGFIVIANSAIVVFCALRVKIFHLGNCQNVSLVIKLYIK